MLDGVAQLVVDSSFARPLTIRQDGAACEASDVRGSLDSGVLGYARTLVAPSATRLGAQRATIRGFWPAAEQAFRGTVKRSGADVALLHRRADGFLYTTAVHGLAEGMHMHVWLSLWDDAARQVLEGRPIRGAAGDSELTAKVARRLGDGRLPRLVLAFPVRQAGVVEGIAELGWRGEGEPAVGAKGVMKAFYGWLKPDV